MMMVEVLQEIVYRLHFSKKNSLPLHCHIHRRLIFLICLILDLSYEQVRTKILEDGHRDWTMDSYNLICSLAPLPLSRV